MTPTSRIESLDVTRAIALFGVVAMNYHAYLNGAQSMYPTHPSVWERMFNPLTGPLTTRFAATFVLIAGIGVSLFTQRARASNNRADIQHARIVLLRRGALLYFLGYFLQWIWPGTILFYYGAYFIIAAAVFAWSSRQLIGLCVISMIGAAGLSWWRASQLLDGNLTNWLSPSPNSPRNLLIRTFTDYTHPVFPWIAFFVAGIVIGRHIHRLPEIRLRLMFAATLLMLATHVANYLLTPSLRLGNRDFVLAKLLSTQPLDRGILFSLGTLATAVVALCLVSLAVERAPQLALTQLLARAGRMTLSVYLLHVIFFNLVVHRLHWVGATGLDTALVLSLSFYVVALLLASGWNNNFGLGPAERVYRVFGG
ncbi:MAG: DUF418 domain-containing protein [Actinobacteria bacterium]|nr:MAG: DUF418 domain-containing protein [Actinomycetota bacterium]